MFQHEGGIDYRVNSRKFISHNNASDLAFPISSHRPFPSEADEFKAENGAGYLDFNQNFARVNLAEIRSNSSKKS